MADSPSDSSNPFSKLVPGFDFLQSLVKNAGAALPGIGQWVAPTLNPEELEKRIEELRTVQFWLEQNARMLGATIQALEVQRMTLSTLKSMDVPLSALRESLTIPVPAAAPEPASAPAAAPDAAPMIDPTQWWTALTQQFTQLATTAMTDTSMLPGAAGKTAPASKPKPSAKRAASAKKAAPAARKRKPAP